MAQDLIDMLVDAGFERVSVVEKEESKEFIKDWLPGSGAEDYVVSANVTAYKPGRVSVAGALTDEDLYEGFDPLEIVHRVEGAAGGRLRERRRRRRANGGPGGREPWRRSSRRWAAWCGPSARTTRSTRTPRARSTAAPTSTARRRTFRRR